MNLIDRIERYYMEETLMYVKALMNLIDRIESLLKGSAMLPDLSTKTESNR